MTRLSVRLRLAIWYSAVSLLLGAGLLAVSYAVVRDNFDRAAARRHVEVESTLRGPRQVRVRIAPGLPEETDPQVRALSAREQHLYAQARDALSTADRNADDEARRRVLLAFLAALIAVAGLAVALGWAIAGRVLRPLDAALAAQRRFVADASHELRTPLTVVRTEIDVTLADPDASVAELRDMAHVVREANDRMERLIEALLALATSGAGALGHEALDLAAITASALARSAPLPDGLTISPALDQAPVRGDAVLLERLAANLIDNAARYNLPDGWIAVRTGVEQGSAALEVTNSGQPITAAQATALFEPFHRLEPSRARSTGGYGLGLAVVRAVVQAHGGTVSAEPLPEGGLRVIARIPAASGVAAAQRVTEPA